MADFEIVAVAVLVLGSEPAVLEGEDGFETDDNLGHSFIVCDAYELTGLRILDFKRVV